MREIEAAQCSKVITKVSHFSDTSRKEASSKRKKGLGCSVLWDEIRDENSAVVLKSNILWVGMKPLRKYSFF